MSPKDNGVWNVLENSYQTDFRACEGNLHTPVCNCKINGRLVLIPATTCCSYSSNQSRSYIIKNSAGMTRSSSRSPQILHLMHTLSWKAMKTALFDMRFIHKTVGGFSLCVYSRWTIFMIDVCNYTVWCNLRGISAKISSLRLILHVEIQAWTSPIRTYWQRLSELPTSLKYRSCRTGIELSSGPTWNSSRTRV